MTTEKIKRIEEILGKYSPSEQGDFKATVDMLASKGVGNGVYQDYTILLDVLEILSICEAIIDEM